MTEALIFGHREAGVVYEERPAAYVVVGDGRGRVAAIAASGWHFLPGGGSLPGETPEETVRREVREELARRVRHLHPLGGATQYFYSRDDAKHYALRAKFFAGEFDGGPLEDCAPEYELRWLTPDEAQSALFHACQAWAVTQA